MKISLHIRTVLLAMATTLFVSCGSGKFKGSASDRSGTNGATTGTGKIAPLN